MHKFHKTYYHGMFKERLVSHFYTLEEHTEMSVIFSCKTCLIGCCKKKKMFLEHLV